MLETRVSALCVGAAVCATPTGSPQGLHIQGTIPPDRGWNSNGTAAPHEVALLFSGNQVHRFDFRLKPRFLARLGRSSEPISDDTKGTRTRAGEATTMGTKATKARRLSFRFRFRVRPALRRILQKRKSQHCTLFILSPGTANLLTCYLG